MLVQVGDSEAELSSDDAFDANGVGLGADWGLGA